MSSGAMNKIYHRKVRARRPLEGAPRGISSYRLEMSSNRVHHPFEASTKAWCGRNDHRRGFETNSRPTGGATSLASLACTSSSRRSSSWNFVVSIGNELKSRPPPFRGSHKSMVRSKRPSKRVRNEFQATWWSDVLCVEVVFVKGGNEIVGSCGRWSYSTHVEISLPSKSWPIEVSR